VGENVGVGVGRRLGLAIGVGVREFGIMVGTNTGLWLGDEDDGRDVGGTDGSKVGVLEEG